MQGRNPSPPRERLRLLASAALGTALAPAAAHALPVGGQVSAGQAAISSSGNTLSVTQGSSRAVIDWQGFNIGSNERVTFSQPSSSSIALNRIHDANPSSINGQLTANGQVWLINPNGVMFGKGAQVNVGGLLATTSDISNSDFMNGNYQFTPGGNASAEVSNAGSITAAEAGLVALVAPSVENSGVITAKLGKVQLASGDRYTLDLYGDGLIDLGVSDAVAQQLVSNSGTLSADGGQVELSAAAASGVVSGVINMSGLIQARSVGDLTGSVDIDAEGSNAVAGNDASLKGQKQGSSIVLLSGNIDASGYGSGQKGGSVEVTGDHVALLSGSSIDASGDAGGGSVKVGGDFHGAGSTPTAEATIMQTGSTIKANAISSGNGGDVALWSDNYTNFAGNISARGGAASGDGGFVETSGHNLIAMGLVNAGAANGNAGTWLLDPNNIDIEQSSCTGTSCSSADTIGASLSGGSNVTVTTTDGSITLGGSGNATITDSGSAATTLTFSAGTDIVLGSGSTTGAITASGSGALNVVFDADTAAGGGAIVANSGSGIATGGGNITLGGGEANPADIVAGTGFAVGDATYNNGVYLNSATLNAGGGNVIINGQGVVSGTDTYLGGIYNAGTIETSGSGAITLTGIGGTSNAGTEVDGILQYGTIQSVDGNITLTGTGGSVSLYAEGIRNYGLSQATGSGGVYFTGTLGKAGDDYDGILLYGFDSADYYAIKTNSGPIVLTAPLGPVTWGYYYHHINNGAVQSNSGDVTIRADKLTETTSSTFDVIQTGGHVTFEPYTASTTIGVAGGAGTLQITGGSTGVLAFTSASGITIGNTADSGAMDVDAYTWNAPLSLVSGSGAITIDGAQAMGANDFTLESDTTPIFNATVTTTGSALIEPASVGTSLGFSGGAGTLQITQAMMDHINAPTITIGRSDSTAALTTGAFNWEHTLDSLSLIGNSVTLGGNLTKGMDDGSVANSDDATLTAQSSTIITVNSNVALSSSGSYGKLNTIFDADNGGTTPNGKSAITFNSGSSIVSNGGDIILGGGTDPTTGYAVGSKYYKGIYLTGNNTLNAGAGDITMHGSSVSYPNGSSGIATAGSNDLIETTTGNILLEDHGGGEFEMALDSGGGGSTLITTQTGSITLTGTAPDATNCFNCIGVAINSGVTISSTGSGPNVGPITITGNAYPNGGSYTFGISTGGATISSVDADITITGTDTSSGLYTPTAGYNIGVNLSGTVESTGSGNITITGIGDINNSNKNAGVWLGGPTVSAHNGSITMTGTGGGYGTDEAGIYFAGTSHILSTGTAPITLTGTGANGTADIEIPTTGSVIGGASAGGNIAFNADSLGFTTLPTIQTSQQVLFQPRTASTSIGVAGGSGTLDLTTGILDNTTAGSLAIGNIHDSGAMNVGAYAWNEPLSLYNGSGSITIDGAQAMGANSFLAESVSGNIAIGSLGSIASSGLGTPITLAASGGDFLNYAGTSALSTPHGRWLVYSDMPFTDALDGLHARFVRFGCSYGEACLSIPAGNGYLFSDNPIPAPVSIVYSTGSFIPPEVWRDKPGQAYSGGHWPPRFSLQYCQDEDGRQVCSPM